MIIAQIVFEFNTSLPYFSLNNLPAMEEAASKLLRKHLNTMYGSRKAFIESETNQKLRLELDLSYKPLVMHIN